MYVGTHFVHTLPERGIVKAKCPQSKAFESERK